MPHKRKQFTPEFKQSAIDFVNAHPEMTVLQCANHLEIGLSTLQRWKREAKENPGQPVPFVGSGNYSSEIEKENIRLQNVARQILLVGNVKYFYTHLEEKRTLFCPASLYFGFRSILFYFFLFKKAVLSKTAFN